MLKRSGKLSVIASMAICLLCPAFAAPLTTVSKFDEAVKSYKDKKYSQSLSQLQKLHDGGMCTDTIHYYMGLCYQSLNQISAAKQEYETVAKGKTPALRANAETALAGLNQWSQHRSYQGNGNNFARYSTPNQVNRLGSRNSTVAREISFDIPMPTGGGGG